MKPELSFQKNITLIVILLALVGLGVSLFLSQQVFTSSEMTPCPLGGGCTAVLHGDYSKFLGIIPLAYMGVLFYLTAIFISIIALVKKQQIFFDFVAYISLIAFASSMIFVGIQVFLLKNICFWCMLSATASTLMFLVTLPILFRKR